MPFAKLPPPLREYSRKAAIVGLGESDYATDYRAARAKAPGWEPLTPEGLATTAFERALADSGLKRSDIDGVTVSFLYGGPDAAEIATMLGIKARYTHNAFGLMAGPVPEVVGAIAEGKCDTVAMIYGVASRSKGRVFGGTNFDEYGGAPSSYFYHNVWGWSSQVAHWAFIWQYYKHRYGKTDADLGEVAMQLRKHAQAHPQAIMQTPMTIEDYLGSRYIVKPLRLFDACLVNDGGVCLIIQRADKARDMARKPVGIAGWGESKVKGAKMHQLVREGLSRQFQDAGAQALSMADISLSDVQHFEGYDASTMHLVNHIEGLGFTKPGEALDWWKDGQMTLGGKLPVNMAGGMLSGSYMHGWNHVAEIVRQIRQEADGRQIPDLEISLFTMAQTDQVHPLILTRGV